MNERRQMLYAKFNEILKEKLENEEKGEIEKVEINQQQLRGIQILIRSLTE